jgi:hypothetical protein
MEEYLINTINEQGSLRFVEIKNKQSLEIIYDLYKNDKVQDNDNFEDVVIYLYYGTYYGYFKKDYDLMEKYYIKGVEQNCELCTYNLHLRYVNNIDDLLKKYYTILIKYGNINILQHYIKIINDCISKKNQIDNMLNDAIEITHQFKYYEQEYMLIKILFKQQCTIRNYYILTKYYSTYNIQSAMAKYIHKCCSHKNIFKNYHNILSFLNICKGINIPKYIKLYIIFSIIN